MILARRPFRVLDQAARYAFSAGQYRGYRDAWIAEARKNTTLPELRSMQVSFAKSAHRAYMHNLSRSLRAQRAQA